MLGKKLQVVITTTLKEGIGLQQGAIIHRKDKIMASSSTKLSKAIFFKVVKSHDCFVKG